MAILQKIKLLTIVRPIKNGFSLHIMVLMLMLLSACSGLRNLPEGEKLYTGADIELEHNEKIGRKKKKNITNVAEGGVRPEPNRSFLGIRPRLWLYQVAGENPESRLGKWIKKKGSPPVLMSQVKPDVTKAIIDARLYNIGIFESYTDYETIEKKRTAKVVYTSDIHTPYTISEVKYSIFIDSLSRLIESVKESSLVEPGEDYNLDILKTERERIDLFLKHRGYFYFSPDYLLFLADTAAEDRSVSLTLILKGGIPESAITVYCIKNVFIDQDYSLSEEVVERTKDTVRHRNNVFRIRGSGMNIKPEAILNSVFLRKGEIYSRRKHNITLNRLMSMGNFKFVQVKLFDSDTSALGYLDVDILMTSMTKRSFRAEMDIVTKSNDFTGPRMNVSLLNRNIFKGAELLYVAMAGSYEAQFGGDENLYSFSLNPNLELTFPRFITPFKIRTENSIYIPKTIVNLSYNYLRRVKYFDMQTIQFGFGYRWRESNLKEHELNPFTLSNTSIRNQSAEFSELLESNPFLKRSYEEQFIAAANYTFVYDDQVLPHKSLQTYLRASVESAGNLFSLGNIISGETPSPENSSSVLGSVYSQYAKFSLDSRVFYSFRDKNKIAVRLFTGVAKPYGNSAVLPYAKQFFSGGSNSIRAFHINSVGPGTFNQDSISIGFLQLGGEIKLEANAEYRFNIYRFFKGALFVDAGNIWLNKSNPETPGSAFAGDKFLSELAAGTGIGIRIDLSFFLLRFDLAMPLRKPWLEDGNRWVIDQINFSDPEWRRDNLILNVAIGYPF
ncbi:MAG: BamA/TamA family outer membrane protein [Bacteroidales bacterium]|nr:BamA/TamA family outer membrane protein [Bacteroidales bacterium]